MQASAAPPPVQPLAAAAVAAASATPAIHGTEIARAQPTPTPARALPKPARAEPKPRPVRQPPAAAPGAGGRDQADAAASAARPGGGGVVNAGGDAASSRYPGLVQAKLKRALRFPAGAGVATGEVQVRFTVDAGGTASGLAVVSSSGSPVLDEAGLDTVRRAAPFPPIPDSAGRSSWTFTMPLRFRR